MTKPNIGTVFLLIFVLIIFGSLISLSTDQQIDGFTFMGTSIKELRKTISNIGDCAKCTRLREQLENLEVRMIANR